MKTKTLIALFILLIAVPFRSEAKSSKNITLGVIGMGNIQLLDTTPQFDPGPGGGAYFDYRFNQRFSITVDAWVTDHDGDGPSQGDDGIKLMGLPTTTIKLYFMTDETSKWDPYAGIGIGLYVLSEGSVGNGTSGLGLGAQIDVGFDYYFNDLVSAGFSGVFRSAGIINNLNNNGNNASATIPFSLMGRLGFHFL